jgi:RNA polymerase sigma-70 factor (ECF subfamily)
MLEGLMAEPAEVGVDALDYPRLAHAHADAAFQLAGYLLGNEADAEDALQDALVKAWRAWPTLREPTSFDAWFDRIVVNVCRDRMRRRRAIRMVAIDEAHEVAGDDRFAAMLARDELGRAVSRLDPDHRAVVALRFWLDLTVDDVARRLDLPAGTVKSRLHYAMESLRAELKAPSRGA